ncbi:type VII secretion integral membrane protein EccD [Streptomyces sp. DSM 44917]|uniref:Type VII secretion integral membrane protein EccD n=1 Tax=Streptomyces boetiae TaxID=3075541 RepID=A0ABU2L292_9ACTN|nr:type VII secretion integral membrane protein EccD [Streptomyces sp. DSM 44917]MDT0305680.1 type VII secretion integral membrane protein EccD [Streptomyces sp. DSM 44917]
MTTSATTPPGPAAATGSAPPAVEFVRIGLAGPAGRADLAVPASVPLARLLPTLLTHAGQDPGPDGGTRHGGWVLRRADGTRLDPAAGLAAQGVAEGDLLFLGHGAEDVPEPLYDDVVEVIGERAVRAPWPAAATRRAAAALTALATLAACGALAAAPGRLPGWLGLAVAAFALAVGVLASRAFADTGAGTFAGVLAAPPAMLGAARLLGTGDGWGAGHLLLACAVLAAVGALGPVLIGGGDGTFTALVTAGALAAPGPLICALSDAGPARAASVAAPLALALTTAWPAVALRVARIPAPQVAATPDELKALPSQLAHDQLAARVARARRLLAGLLTGSHVVAGGGTLVLFADDGLWPGVLGGTLVLLTLLRARLFRDAAQTAVPLATALAGAAGAAAFTVLDARGETAPLLGALLPAALAVALISGATALFAGRVRTNPRASRALDLLETALLLAVVPLTLAAWEVYTALLDLRA